MWWRETTQTASRHARGAFALIFAGVLCVAAGGCGFHPLYGPTASGANVSEVMKTIDVATIPSRLGQRLRNELIFGTTGGGDKLATAYRLDVAVRETFRNTLITTSGLSTGQILQVDAEYRLVRLKDNEVVYKGYSTAEAAYDLVGATGTNGSIYGDTRAPIDAENRVARTLGDEIKTRLAAYVSSAA